MYDKDPAQSQNGLFFFPASNETGSTYDLAFMAQVNNKEAMEIVPTIGPTEYIDYVQDPLLVEKDATAVLPKEAQLNFNYRPVSFKSVDTVLGIWKYVGSGLQQRSTIIRDRKDDYRNVYKMSDLIRGLCLAHTLPYTPDTFIFSSRDGGNCTLKTFQDIEFSMTNLARV
jgi:hypothetical protein